MTTTTQNKSIEQPYGWVIVFVGTMCLAMAFGANVSVSVLIEPLEQEFGWWRADISMAYTMVTAGAAVGGLVWGPLSDRIGAKSIVTIGATVLSLAMMSLSFQSALFPMYLLYLIIGGFGFACMFTPILALASQWFDRRRGLALGLVTAGGALGQGVVPVVLRELMEGYGWRDAIFFLGMGYFVILMPLMFLLRRAPESEVGGTVSALSDDNAWGIPHRITLPWLGFAGVLCCICMAVPIVHLVPLGNALCSVPGTGTKLLMTAMLCGVFGRIFFGSLADRIGGMKAYAIASLAQTTVVFWFTQTTSEPALFTLAALFGFGFSGVMTCLIISVREATPGRMAGSAVSIVTACGLAGMGIGGFMGGWLYDISGSYELAYTAGAVAGVANLIVVAALALFRSKQVPTPTFA